MLNNPAISNFAGKIPSSKDAIPVLNKYVGNFITLAFGLSGILLLFMLLWGAYEYITSGSDKEATQKATKRITTALIGICILFSVYAIIAVVETLFGLKLTSIGIPSINQ